MAELKPFEVIMRLSPKVGYNSKAEICFAAENVAELVRCKDCKYRYGDKDEPYCSRINPYSGMRVEDNDFCSWGEKNGNNY